MAAASATAQHVNSWTSLRASYVRKVQMSLVCSSISRVNFPCIFTKSLHPLCSHRTLTSSATITKDDIVFLKHKINSSNTPILTPKLLEGKKLDLPGRDTIEHNEILGKVPGLGIATSRKKVAYRVFEPTLAEYTDHSPRIVTPIYSQDASLIVSLLDLNPTVPGQAGQKIEIFEAGTGHGALTLHLARAIHGANTPAPAIPSNKSESEPETSEVEIQEAYQAWRARRRAVIHTLDISAKHSAQAHITVRNFRKGIYYPNIDFHVGNIEDLLSTRLAEDNGEPFLDHAILDLPNTHNYLEIIKQSLKPNGKLLAFCPSITQINKCAMFAKENGIPIYLDTVLELGAGLGVGGREWDVRPVKPRTLLRAETKVKDETEEATDSLEDVKTSFDPVSGWEIVCRPKVGVRTFGGGFLGVWRKMVVEK